MRGRKIIPLTGARFGKWKVIGEPVKRGRKWYVECICDCGTKREVRKDHLPSGKSTNCGCEANLHRIEANTKHGESTVAHRAPEHVIWARMKQRCGNPNDLAFADYGGRGIQVCQKWQDSYEAFLADVGRRPSAKHSIERIENNGNYEPGNVKWATRDEQANNKRTSRFVEFNGTRQTVKQWSVQLGISYDALHYRLQRGWSIEKTLTTPLQ